MTTAPEFVDAVRQQQRAARHTVSLTLIVHALALAALTVLNTRFEWHLHAVELLLPGAVYLVLWMVVRLRRRFTGIGGGRERFGTMALVGGFLLLLFPFSLIAVTFVGTGTLLGLGLVVIGARLHAPRLWGPAIALIAVCPLVGLYTFDNHARFLGSQPGTVVLAVLTTALVLLAVSSYMAERATLRAPSLP